MHVGFFIWNLKIREHPVNGRESVPSKDEISNIIVCNHVSPCDIMFFIQKNLPSFLSKVINRIKNYKQSIIELQSINV